mmetsp:Transcript_6769/g.14697  ORF Transcript_6769/g.14697 Transcript_6769/m.14697 type:complete len:89 (+) Transcript_6769:3-269(+)
MKLISDFLNYKGSKQIKVCDITGCHMISGPTQNALECGSPDHENQCWSTSEWIPEELPNNTSWPVADSWYFNYPRSAPMDSNGSFLRK